MSFTSYSSSIASFLKSQNTLEAVEPSIEKKKSDICGGFDVIDYCNSIRQSTDKYLNELVIYEKNDIIDGINAMALALAENHNYIGCNNEEISALTKRQKCLYDFLSLDTNKVKAKILALKKEADDIDIRINTAFESNDIIHNLASIENDERASIIMIDGCLSKLVNDMKIKFLYYRYNYEYISCVIDKWKQWNESYIFFKTNSLPAFENMCKSDDIENGVINSWLDIWQRIRFSIEEKFLPIIEKELSVPFKVIEKNQTKLSLEIINELEVYKKNIDEFFASERKGIYLNYVFQPNGELQDKLETESRIYKLTAQFQKQLQNIIFNCENSEDRVFILDWASSLLDIQIDDVIDLIADIDMTETSDTVLTELSNLKQRNYDFYLADAKSYGQQQEKRDNEFNALLFKMRKGLMEKKG